MEIKKNLVDHSMYIIKCPYRMTPELIVVHNTDNDASAKNEVAYMRRNDNEVSFHFAVDDQEIWQGVPLDRNTWNAGDGEGGKGNRKGISVEICYSKSGGARFTKAEERAAAFIAELLIERGWSIDRVTKHQDYNGKSCPKRTLSLGWQRFLDMIQDELDKQTAPAVLYRVQVGAYRDKQNAENMLARLKTAGFDGTIVTDEKEPAEEAEPEKTEETKPAKDLAAVAKKVRDGAYGNGSARKRKLISEGFTEEEIKEIQKIVNSYY